MSVNSFEWKNFTVKAMDQSGHVTRFLYLIYHISVKNEVTSWKFVWVNKMH